MPGVLDYEPEAYVLLLVQQYLAEGGHDTGTQNVLMSAWRSLVDTLAHASQIIEQMPVFSSVC